MNSNSIFEDHPDVEPKPVRQQLGRRDKAGIIRTLLRVVGKEAKAPAVDVAAFQSFAD